MALLRPPVQPPCNRTQVGQAAMNTGTKGTAMHLGADRHLRRPDRVPGRPCACGRRRSGRPHGRARRFPVRRVVLLRRPEVRRPLRPCRQRHAVVGCAGGPDRRLEPRCDLGYGHLRRDAHSGSHRVPAAVTGTAAHTISRRPTALWDKGRHTVGRRPGTATSQGSSSTPRSCRRTQSTQRARQAS